MQAILIAKMIHMLQVPKEVKKQVSMCVFYGRSAATEGEEKLETVYKRCLKRFKIKDKVYGQVKSS